MDFSMIANTVEFKAGLFKSIFTSKRFSMRDLFSITFFPKKEKTNISVNIRENVFRDYKNVRVNIDGSTKNGKVTFKMGEQQFDCTLTEAELENLISAFANISF